MAAATSQQLSVNTDVVKPKLSLREPSTQHPRYSTEISTITTASANNADSMAMQRRREKKLGHRRVDYEGNVTYKKKPTSELMAALQLGLQQSIGSLANKPMRDMVFQDFFVVQTTTFPRDGSSLTPAHHFTDYRFKTYAPVAFRYFRELFGIQPDDFLLSLCNEPMRELSNPGASGSIFYVTEDDEFIVKTVQHNEAEFLQKLLPGYYMNLNQNPRTLLPKFYGLYTYQCSGKNIRVVAMNNLLPSSVKYHEKYDLKGSTYKRKASKSERSKASPTLKDLDFMELHPEGFLLEADTYSALIKTIERDCRVLQSFKIMDYSLLLGVHNLDIASKEKLAEEPMEGAEAASPSPIGNNDLPVLQNPFARGNQLAMSRGRSVKQRLAQYSTTMEAIQAYVHPLDIDFEDIPPGGIPARNVRGERLLLYLGIIDILQSYRFRKKLEHAMKSMVHDGDTISVHKPGFYAQRFQDFFREKVFRKVPSPMKHSPSKKRAGTLPSKFINGTEIEGAVGGRPDLLPENTPSTLPARHDNEVRSFTYRPSTSQIGREPALLHSEELYPNAGVATRLDFDVHGDHMTRLDSLSSPLSSRVLGSPEHSDSTHTYTERTEGTPSYTPSSPSYSSDVLDSTPSTDVTGRKYRSSQHVVEMSDTEPDGTHTLEHRPHRVLSAHSSTSGTGPESGYRGSSEIENTTARLERQEEVPSSDPAEPTKHEALITAELGERPKDVGEKTKDLTERSKDWRERTQVPGEKTRDLGDTKQHTESVGVEVAKTSEEMDLQDTKEHNLEVTIGSVID